MYDGDDYFQDAVEDMKEFSSLIRNAHPNEKIILFGHSMGSFFSREYVTKYGDDIQLLVLSGTASFIKVMGTIGLIGANVVKFFNGGKRSNDVLKAMFFNEFSKQFKPNRTKVDWISSDEEQVDLFDKDPLRIEDFSTKVFIDIINGNKKVNEKKAFRKTPKELPIYMFAGESDPVGEMGKGVRKVAKQYNCVVAGSILVTQGDKKVNRFYWASADGSVEYYDKRLLIMKMPACRQNALTISRIPCL